MNAMTAAAEFTAGKELLAAGRSFAALPLLEHAYAREPGSPEHQSYFGLVVAIERGQVRLSVDLCREALTRAPEMPELYVNLARVHLKAGQKREAIEVLHAGLTREPQHAGLQELACELGVRRRPLFSALPRQHLFNRLLGLVAVRLRLR